MLTRVSYVEGQIEDYEIAIQHVGSIVMRWAWTYELFHKKSRGPVEKDFGDLPVFKILNNPTMALEDNYDDLEPDTTKGVGPLAGLK